MPLAEMFLAQERHVTGRFTVRARRVLEAHPWPGNVRELANAVKHGAVLAGDADVDVAQFPEEVVSPVPVAPPAGSLLTLAEAEREHVVRILAACGGRQLTAARVLGIGRTTLWRKLKVFGIETRD